MVVDDEPLARLLIEKNLSGQPGFVLVAACKNTLQAEVVLSQQEVDLIFLDINLPKMSGIEWVKKTNPSAKIIITTAHPEFAVEGFDLDVVDYIVKPVTAERFLKALNKFKPAGVAINEPPVSPTISIKSKGYFHRIPVKDIVFAEAIQKYVCIYTNTTVFETLMPLTKLEKSLDSKLFFRCHKSYLVQLSLITGMKGYTVYAGKFKVPVSRALKALLADRLAVK